MAHFGHFNSEGNEFIVNQPLLPIRHLINFSWNNHLISGVNQFGTGEGVFNNQTLLYNDSRGRAKMIKDGRRYFYLRDEAGKVYWNLGYFPVKYEPAKLTTIFGAGYSKFIHTTEGIQSEMLCFVAHDEPVEVWVIKVTNLTKSNRKLKVYPYVEWLLQGYPISSDYYSYLKSEYLKDLNTVISINQSDERPHERYTGFVASSIKPTGYCGSVREFMGIYGEPSRPQCVITGACSNQPTCNENLAGALEIPLELAEGESKEFTVLIGNTSDLVETRRVVAKIFGEGYLKKSFKLLKKAKADMTNHTLICTPDAKINTLINVWAKNQITLCLEFGRDGVRGFRDTLQDAWAILSFNPELAKEKIIESLRHQCRNGSTLRGWMPAVTKQYSDGPTWITPVVTEYIKYTGDQAILDEIVPYYDGGEATILEHMIVALRHLRKNRGRHGLCLAFKGDWNDSLDWMGKEGKGESVMTSMAYYLSLNCFVELEKEILKQEDLTFEMMEAAEEIRLAIEEHAWDGDWYLQGYSDRGSPVGSKENLQGKIYLVPQAWAIFSGAASKKRRQKCIAAVEKYLDAKTGCVMCHPAFTRADKNVGRLTVILPGMYENASTYCHGSAFMIAAYLLEGRANDAYKLYQKVMPDSEGHPADVSGVEPYAFTNQYLGPDSLRAGQSISGWITGTAGWMYGLMINYFLGFRPGYQGVYINPCLPEEWREASLSTTLRNTEYKIKIQKGTGKKGEITVDGETLEGSFIPYSGKKKIAILINC